MRRPKALAAVAGILVLAGTVGILLRRAPTENRPRVSPYALAARRQAESARVTGHAPLSPTSMRTRRAINRVPPQ
jgi:hypothetical protein